MKNFFHTLVRSLYSPEFYRGVPDGKTGDAVKYFFGFLLLIAILFSVMPMAAGLGFFLAGHNEADQAYEQARGVYPDDLVVKVDQGEVSINQSAPYLIPTPPGWIDGLSDGDASSGGFRIENLAVFNTEKPIASEDFRTYQTLVIVDKNEVGTYDPGKKKMEIYSLGSMHENITIDQATYTAFLDKAWKVVRVIAVVGIVLLPILFLFGFTIGYGIYLLFGALAIWLAFIPSSSSIGVKRNSSQAWRATN